MCHPILFSSKYLLLLPKHYYEFSCLILKHLEMSTFFIIDFYLLITLHERILQLFISVLWNLLKFSYVPRMILIFENVESMLTGMHVLFWWVPLPLFWWFACIDQVSLGLMLNSSRPHFFFLPVRSISKKCELNFLSMIMIFSFSPFCFSRSNFYVV